MLRKFTIGPDYIGDITSQLIKKQIYMFTEIQSKDIGVPTQSFNNLIPGESFELPVHPSPPKKQVIPILFVPRDILTPLPTDVDIEDVFESFISDSEIIRQGVNVEIANILQNSEQKNDRQSKILELIRSNKHIAAILGEFVSNFESYSYDFETDIKGFLLKEKLINNIDFSKIKRPEDNSIETVVNTVITEFKKFIDNDNDTKRLLLWKDEKRNQPESHWQRVFHIFSHVYLEQNNIDISPETATGVGFVDFKLSKGSNERILVEMKLSKNLKSGHGLTTQLEAYKECFNNVKTSYFIYVDLDKKAETSNRKRGQLAALNKELKLGTNIIEINGLFGPSASNL